MSISRTSAFIALSGFSGFTALAGKPESIKRMNILFVFADDWGRYAGCYKGLDGRPTKAWIIQHRNDPEWQWYFEFAFGKRPQEELYDRKNDPDMVNNLAGDPRYSATKKKLADRLMKELTRAGDPRVTEYPPRFENPPFTLP